MRKGLHRLGSAILILSMIGTSVSMPVNVFQTKKTVYAQAAQEEDVQKVSDVMQIKVDDETVTDLQLYYNGMYEAKVQLDAGEHAVQVLKNESTYQDERTITVEESQTVYVRVKDGEIVDSVNEKEQFHTAAIVGNFEAFDFLDEKGETFQIAKWNPADANAELTYQGGGIFARTFSFSELKETMELPDNGYKVAVDDGWDVSYGDGAGNIGLTLPAGTSRFTVMVDTFQGKVYDSIRSGSFTVNQNAGNVSFSAFDLNVSIIGTVRNSEEDNWDIEKTGYEFRQLSDALYIYEKTLGKGSYSYKTVFNHANWYEYGDGNKSFSLTEEKKVIFLYNAKTQELMDSVTSEDLVAQILGMEAEKAVSKVLDNPNGTTAFLTTQANEGDDVKLVYAPKADIAELTTVAMKEGKDAKGKFNGTFVSDPIFFGDEELDYVFYYIINGKFVLDDVAAVVEVNGKSYSVYTRGKYEGRFITVPGTFPGPSWNAASNQMEYCGNGMYQYTFENVPAGNYEFKIATGTWDENYGVDGKPDGSNYAVAVPKKQDITVYYIDFGTHRAVTSLSYKFAQINLSGDGVNEKLVDPGLTGIFSTTVSLEAGKYENLILTYGEKQKKVDPIELTEAKEITFFFDPATEIFYNNSTKVEVNAEAVKYDSKDAAYKSVYGAVAEGQEVTFSLDTGKDATKAELIVAGAETINYNMELKDNGEKKIWSKSVSFDTYGQYTYFFAVYYGAYVQIYCDDDGYYGTGKLTDLSALKAYDLVVYKDGFKTPDWMKNAVIYQIFPDRFFNADTSNDEVQKSSRGSVNYEFPKDWYTLPENPEQEDGNPDQYPANAFVGDRNWNNEMYGGDLKGITERMDYLKALGVNVIYLNPVFSSISSHRYDATDYRKIDPILGDLGDFQKLVKIAEENNMHIVLDGVFNHVSDDSVYFDRYYKFVGQDKKVGAYPYWAFVYDYMKENEVTKEEAKAAAKEHFTALGVEDFSYTEWFLINQDTIKDEDEEEVCDTIGDRKGLPVYSYEGWWGYDSMPVIMSTEGSEYQTGNWAQEIIDGDDCVTQYWISQGSNGWRLDVANEVSDETWQHFRQSVKGLDSDAVIIGEIWDDATEYILGDMYDSVMNYVFRNAVLSFAKGGSAKESVKELEKIRERYPKEAFYAMMNLVGSHDTARLLSFLDGVDDDRNQKDAEHAFPTYEKTSEEAKQSQYLVALIQMTYAGAPTIYYGDELGMTGADDPDNRRAMIWGKGNKELLEWYARLASIRSQYEALRTGELRPIDLDDDALMGYVRTDGGDTLCVITNNSMTEKTITYKMPEELQAAVLTITDIISGEEYSVDDGEVVVTIPAKRGVVLTQNVKDGNVDYKALEPGYAPSYIVEKKEEATVPPTASPVPTVSPLPTVKPSPTTKPSPSVKPVKKTQTITVAASSYTKEAGSKSWALKAKAKGTLTYKSSNSSVASVSKNGTVTVKAVGKAVITITAAETNTYKKATKTVTVKVIPKRIGCTLKKQYAKKKYAVVVSWKKSKVVSGYEVEYATNAKFNKKKTAKVAAAKSSFVIKNAKKKATYYVRIRTYKVVKGVKYYSGYSDVRKMKI